MKRFYKTKQHDPGWPHPADHNLVDLIADNTFIQALALLPIYTLVALYFLTVTPLLIIRAIFQKPTKGIFLKFLDDLSELIENEKSRIQSFVM